MLPLDDAGSGPPVVLLHAGVADRSMWTETTAALAAAGFRAIAVDLPGFGEAPPGAGLHEALLATLDELGLERVALVGNSFGGSVALGVPILAPDRVTSLLLVSALAPFLEPSPQLQAIWEAEEEALERGDLDAAVEAVLEAWVRPDAPPGVRERVGRMQRQAFERALAADEGIDLEDPVEADGGAGLDRLALPVTVAVGEHEISDVVDSGRWLADRLAGGRVEVIAGAGHLAPLEQPERFQALLLDHLRPSTARV